ncbi:TldD/PmbA family protein [Metallosphaera tengchongensis]|uniref:TldD/PmbA family protein n=1 Tax=Metallosphaera tengchongensis TaxID=1532350 RepID=A0A6N0NSG1_9CREN|nr:TldD/PmbA family protein [Metallosphaera tengchongensis]QKQ99641.1 TldD/PmbA family protein [Metallosphaera tengchongensis]
MSDIYKIIERCKALGYTCEVYGVDRLEYNVRVEKQYYSGSLRDRGYGVRVFKEGRVGFSFGSNVSEALLEKAIDALGVSDRDEYNTPPPRSKPTLIGIKPARVDENALKELVKSLEELKERINVLGIYSGVEKVKVSIASTEGTEAEEERGEVYAGIMANFRNESLVTPEIYESSQARDIKDLDIEELKERIARKVQITKQRVKLDKPPTKVVLNVKAVAQLVAPLVSYSVNGENVFRGKTSLKLHGVYGSITIVDDPRDVKSPYSRSFDGEGQETSPTVLFEKGKFTNVLTNWYWSRRGNVKNTASAVRSFSSVPHIGVTTIKFDPSEKDDLEEGDLVVDQVQGVHTSNWDTGEFGVVASIAWIIKGGDEMGVREAILSGDLKSVLKGVKGGIGKRRREDNTESPDLSIEGLRVTY